MHTVLIVEGDPAPRVALVDVQLPDGSGIDVIRAMRRGVPGADARVIGVFGDEAHVIPAIEAGATGSLLKDADTIAVSIMNLIAGQSPISASIACHVLRRLHAEVQPSSAAPRLAPREADVLRLIAKGLSYARIADALQMSPDTVPSCVTQIDRKLEVNSRGEAVFEALQRGLLRPPN
ncbi:MAG: response regulator transcription factor [Rubrivivax sp.]